MKLMIAAGGTGGHVYPALAVADLLRAQGHGVVWLGAPDSFESRVVPAQGIELETVAVRGLRGKGLLRLLRAPLEIVSAILQSLRVLRSQRPDVVLGMGGFAAGPGGIAARLLGVPLVIHEQNAAAGLTNRGLAWVATRALQAFPNTFKRGETVGNPVRAGFLQLPAPAQRLQHAPPARVLVLGGSQGARALNEGVPAALAQMTPAQRPQVRHQAGRTFEVAEQAYARHGVDAVLERFIDDVPAALAWADLVVCRAGASTVAELGAAGCASVLVPFPFAVDDHQTRNAAYLVERGASVLLPEQQLTPQSLAQTLSELLADRERLQRMADAARAAAWTDATQSIARACLDCARESGR